MAAPPPPPSGYAVAPSRSEIPTHIRLLEVSKNALIKIFLFPYAAVCELYCGQVPDETKWDEAQIGHYIGIDVEASGISQVREAWESLRKTYTSDFFELDPSMESLEQRLQEIDQFL